MGIEFNEEESKQIDIIAQYHDIAKELLIFGEQIDPENRTLTQPINELRNCLDHLCRVISYKFGRRNSGNAEDYINKNLDKSFSHVYRAAYDTLDWVALTLKEQIIKELEGFSTDTISAALPSYYPEIKPRFERIIKDEISKLRIEKDVAATNEKNLIKYGQITLELKALYQKILDAKSGMVEIEGKRKRQKIFTYAMAFITGGGFMALVLWLLNLLIFNKNN